MVGHTRASKLVAIQRTVLLADICFEELTFPRGLSTLRTIDLHLVEFLDANEDVNGSLCW